MELENLITLTGTIIIPLIVPIITWKLGSSNEKSSVGKEWTCNYINSSATRFGRFFVFSFVLAPILLALITIVAISLKVSDDNLQSIVLGGSAICYIIFMIIVNVWNYKKRIFISKKDNKVFEWFVLNLTMVSNLIMYLIFFDDKNSNGLVLIPYIGIILAEMLGLLCLDENRKYQYKKAKVILNNGDVIRKVYSNKISVKGKWFIIGCKDGNSEKEVRILQECVYKIEYYDKQY